MKTRYTSKSQAKTTLADDFTALLTELEVLDKVTVSAPLTEKFNRVYRALSRADEADGR